MRHRLLRRWAALLCALALSFVAARASAQSVPAIEAPVTDLAQVLTKSAVDALSAKLRKHREEHDVQIAVLLVRTTHGEPIEDYSIRVANAWGGGSKERDNGALIVLALDDRRMRLEVGYGLEARIPDARARWILDAATLHLRKVAYDDAVHVIVDRVIHDTRVDYTPVVFGPLTWQQILGAYFLFAFLTVAGAWLGGWARGLAMGPARVFNQDRTRLHASVFDHLDLGFVFFAAGLVVAACAVGGYLGVGWCQGAALYSGIALGARDHGVKVARLAVSVAVPFMLFANALLSATLAEWFGWTDTWWIGLWALSAYSVYGFTFE